MELALPRRFGVFLITSLVSTSTAWSATNKPSPDPVFRKTIQSIFAKHAQKYRNIEYFSGAALSINLPSKIIYTFYAGNVSLDGNSEPVSKKTLFQIGSITKSFTAAVLLQLEQEKKLAMSNTIRKWLPEYKKWGKISLTQLMNMTSGLPNYSDTPLWNILELQNPKRVWKNAELISMAYPNDPFNPPRKRSFFYTNTGYLLADMIVEKQTKNSFKKELEKRTIKKANLKDTFYPLPTMSKVIKKRMADGYNYNQYDNPPLLGTDISDVNLTWAAAAGGIVSDTNDITEWVRALFEGNQILNRTSKQKLTSLVSYTSGKPIKETNEAEPKGFGLGVIESYRPGIGRFWFYEGETLGFRALYMYTPCNGVIIASVFNSATNSENDHAGELMMNTYEATLKRYPELQCNQKPDAVII